MSTFFNLKSAEKPISINVGIPHFKTLIDKIRASSYTSDNSLLDIVDNIRSKNCNILITYHNGKPDTIKISDDYENGFENIESCGSDNPFNMGHRNINQSCDEFTSQFGVGLKEASVYLANELEVITRICIRKNIKYYSIKMPFKEMYNESDPCKSYQPQIAEVSNEYYRLNHINHSGYTIGSTILLKSLRSGTDSYNFTDKLIKENENENENENANEEINKLTKEQQTKRLEIAHIKHIVNILSKTYNEQIRCNKKTIYVNQQKVEPQPDIFENNICKQRLIQTKIKVLLSEDDKTIERLTYIQTNTDDDKLFEWNIESNRPNIIKGKMKDICDNNCITLVLKSTSVINTDLDSDFNKGKYLYCNRILIVRDGRNHGDIPLIRARGDGYMNHVINQLEYKSKKLNDFIGIGSTKGIAKRDNPLMNCLTKILKGFESTTKGGLHSSLFKPEIINENCEEKQNILPIITVIEPIIVVKKPKNIDKVKEPIIEKPIIEKPIIDIDEVKEQIIDPSIILIPKLIHKTITITEGLLILTKLYNSNNDDIFKKFINKMIIIYMDKCSPDQINILLSDRNLKDIYELLIRIIHYKYPNDKSYNTDIILNGSEIHNLYLSLKL